MNQLFISNDRDTVVETVSGKLRGFKYGDVYSFRGIPYAKAKRFRMPEAVDSWEGIKDATEYGYICPMLFDEGLNGGDVTGPHRYWPANENCQNLNVWTRSINSDVKKPVIVWFHGGGFFSGSSVDQLSYDGYYMAEAEDVVMVTVNHRLNLLGYMDLREFGPERSRSVNAGNMDMVWSLKWVHENISRFGGDPDNVTIFGQSGGGGKVITLMQMPEAQGLFHRGMIMSGVLGELLGQDSVDTKPVVLKTLELLGLTEAEMDQMDEIPYRTLSEAYCRAYFEVTGKFGIPYFGPMKNEDYLGNPVKNGFCDFAKNIPIMIGSTFSEFNGNDLGLKDKNDSEVMAYLTERYGEEAAAAAAGVFKKTYPDQPLRNIVHVDCDGFRYYTKEWIDKRTEENCAPTYAYLFNPCFNLNGGTMAWHCSDIPFYFHSLEVSPVSNFSEGAKILEAQMSGAFANFARTGRPFHETLPEWPASEVGAQKTMIFDLHSEVRVNHDDELISVLRPMHLAPGLFG